MTYTAEEVRDQAERLSRIAGGALEYLADVAAVQLAARMLSDYAALLERQAGGVPDEVVATAIREFNRWPDQDVSVAMDAALNMVWPVAAEPVAQGVPRTRREQFLATGYEFAEPVAQGEAVEMSPEFTDSARGAIAWVLYHHQGGSSPIGQPLRFALGMDAHERLPDHLIAQAKRWAARVGATTADFHPAAPLGVPAEMVLVPCELSPEMAAAAAAAVWPVASDSDRRSAITAARIVLATITEPMPGATLDSLAASLATMFPAWRAMLAAAPQEPQS